MLGITIIHLSDLHIECSPGKKQSAVLDAIDLTVDRLVADLSSLAQDYRVALKTDETFVIVTGDITSHATWEEYDVALGFFRELRRRFADAFQGSQLLPDHIICIPGNHDIEVPAEADQPRRQIGVGDVRYRNFKLFLDAVTEYADYARRFTLKRPYVDAGFPSPFPVHFFDVGTCANIHAYERPRSSEQVYLTRSQVSSIEQSLPGSDALHLGLMHHPMAAFPSEDDGDAMSQDSTRSWLLDNGFSITLCGHLHIPKEGRHQDSHLSCIRGLWELGTGHSLLLRAEERGNFYQVLRIEPSTRSPVALYRRMYAWCVQDTLDRIDNRWGEQEYKKPVTILDTDELLQSIPRQDYRHFLGIGESDQWAVVSHCESGKFKSFGLQSPGEEINQNMLEISGHPRGQLDTVDENSSADWNKYTDKNALFLVDSPHYNPYVRWILDNYSTCLSGGLVAFVDELDTAVVKQRIEVLPGKPFLADKTSDMDLFGKFEDYLLIMKLPSLAPTTRPTGIEVSDVDKHRIVWVVAGIHSKGSYAGAKIFTPTNLQKFQIWLQKKSGGMTPDYFEAVFKICREPERVEDFDLLECVHFRVLRLKWETALGDGLPSGISRRLTGDPSGASIPIESAHIDPVAACNCNCPLCIEDYLKKKGLCLSLKTYSRIACELRDAGCQYLNFYGGEPTLHPDFPEMVLLAANIGFHMLIVTNGTRLVREHVKRCLVAAKNRAHVRVSLDANSEEMHQEYHGLLGGAGRFQEVRQGTVDLIQAGVSVTVSFLLRHDPDFIRELEDACCYWKTLGAAGMILRPMTDPGGVTPHLNYAEKQKLAIQSLLAANTGFVLTPQWFERWLSNGHVDQGLQKDYQTCYSAYYRVAISPLEEESGGREVREDGVTMTETDRAWLSLCTYRRYDPNFGTTWPVNLKEWLQKDRSSLIARIDPSEQCAHVVCCRHGYNSQVAALLGKIPTEG